MVNNQLTIQSQSPPGIVDATSTSGTALPSDRVDADNDEEISAEEFERSFGEDIRHTLDVNKWRVGNDLSLEYSRIEREVRDAVQREGELHAKIRTEVFPRLKEGKNLPRHAGVHSADMNIIKQIHEGLLFNGGVEACDGNIRIHFTTPLTIYQIGVSLVSYRGDQGTWCQRLFHHDLRQKSGDLTKELLDVLQRRSQRTSERAGMGELVQKAMMDYGERAILLKRSSATWRMGHGNPVTYEMLTGGGNLHLMMEATLVLRELIERHQKFVFVASEPRDHFLMTLGQALRPMEFAIVRTLDEELQDWLHQQRFAVHVGRELTWDTEPIQATQWIPRFIKTVASRVVVGLYRATHFAPAQKFYAHVDHADLAAHIVLADSMMQEHRGFPLLADMARRVCHTEFGETLEELAETAYAEAGAPWRYSSERSNRNR